MTERITLETLFVNSEKKLRDSLSGLTVPKDSDKIQLIISEHLSSLLLEEGEFRQNLTQSEDYILQAVIAILNAQQARFTCFPKVEIESDFSEEPKVETKSEEIKQDCAFEKKVGQKSINLTTSSVAAGVGALSSAPARSGGC